MPNHSHSRQIFRPELVILDFVLISSLVIRPSSFRLRHSVLEVRGADFYFQAMKIFIVSFSLSLFLSVSVGLAQKREESFQQQFLELEDFLTKVLEEHNLKYSSGSPEVIQHFIS